ncbi:PD-(D/E)XK motif protein [Candidatus Palauibacter sp.]|uniref:PD-(D/E)XK motif protein n=1 Tax=Candidatus Palauibacter sp. TaxID=3101350 RepID=UPI003B52580E
MMTSDHPWGEIEPPRESGNFSARRIPGVGSGAWGLYWALDEHRNYLLMLQLGADRRPSHRLPTLKGLRVEVQSAVGGATLLLIVRLTDEDHLDIFHRLCRDIVEATRSARSGEEAADRLVMRTWRWHRLLRGGRDGRLSHREQMGLIGELLVLQGHVLNTVPPREAVESWGGPLGFPRDFEIGLIGIEAKARAPLTPVISISSAGQLHATGTSRLFLHVSEVGSAPQNSGSAVTVTDVARRTRELIRAGDMSADGGFEERLLATGFDWTDDYSDSRWLIGEEALFEVVEGFPRITPEIVPDGVDEVRYVIALSQCREFRVEKRDLADAMLGGLDAD